MIIVLLNLNSSDFLMLLNLSLVLYRWILSTIRHLKRFSNIDWAHPGSAYASHLAKGSSYVHSSWNLFIWSDGIDSIQILSTFGGVWPSTKNSSVFKRWTMCWKEPKFSSQCHPFTPFTAVTANLPCVPIHQTCTLYNRYTSHWSGSRTTFTLVLTASFL